MDFISVVSTVVPKTKKIFDALKIPYAVVVNPCLSVQLNRVQFPRNAIVRCQYCNSYISLYSRVDLETWTWNCAICTNESTLPESYKQTVNLNATELVSQNYEIYAEEKYMERPPMCPCYLILLDISEESVNSGYLNIVCDSLITSITSKIEQNEERTLFGILLFSDSTHLVTISPFIQITDSPNSLSEPWLPLPAELLLLDLVDNYEKILQALKFVKNLHGSGTGKGFKRSLSVARVLLENNGGKILSFLCNPCHDSVHPKKLSFLPPTDFYHKLAQEFVDIYVSVDVFVAGNRFCSFFTYTELSKRTGGEAFYYKDFDQNSSECIQSNINRVMLGVKGWEAGLRLRLSTDWKIYERYGNFWLKNDLLQIPCYQNSCLTFDLALKFDSTEHFLTLQASFLYTSSDGIRLIRVMNYQVAADDNIDEILKSINTDVLINLYFKHAIGLVFKRHVILAGPKFLETKSIELLKNCLIAFENLPPNLTDFLVKILGLIKHSIFANSFLPCNAN